MSKELNYKLVYVDNGEVKTRPLLITFTSNYVRQCYNKTMTDAMKVRDAFDAVNDIQTKIAAAVAEAGPLNKLHEDKKIEALREEKKSKLEALSKIVSMDQFDYRVNIVIRLLQDNGILDGKLLSYDFWNECVDPNTILDFLHHAVYKDIDEKKNPVELQSLVRTA